MSTNKQRGLTPHKRPNGPRQTNVERRRELARTWLFTADGGETWRRYPAAAIQPGPRKSKVVG